MVRSNWELARVRPHKMLSSVYTKIQRKYPGCMVMFGSCNHHRVNYLGEFFPPIRPEITKKGQRTLIDTEKKCVLPVQPFHSVYKVINTYFPILDERRGPARLICPPFPHHRCNVGYHQPVNTDWLLCSDLLVKNFFF